MPRLPSILLTALMLLAAPLLAQSAPQPPVQSAIQSATLTGTVTDPDTALLPNAQLILAPTSGSPSRSTSTDPTGRFTFTALTPGPYTLTASAPRFATIATPVTLAPGQSLELPAILLAVAATEDISVQPSRAEMAAEDVRLEESQRALGVLPNFFVTYNWHAPPLARRQKLDLSIRSIVDPATIAASAIVAGAQQADNAFPGYRQGASGYFKRFGAVQADATVGNLLGGAVFPILFRQDPRYFYLGRGTILHRALYALATAVITRGDNGRWQPNYSGVLGDIATGAVSNHYYPPPTATEPPSPSPTA